MTKKVSVRAYKVAKHERNAPKHKAKTQNTGNNKGSGQSKQKPEKMARVAPPNPANAKKDISSMLKGAKGHKTAQSTLY